MREGVRERANERGPKPAVPDPLQREKGERETERKCDRPKEESIGRWEGKE